MRRTKQLTTILEAFIQQPGYHSIFIMSLRFGTVWKKAAPEDPFKNLQKFLWSLCEFARPLTSDPSDEFSDLEISHAGYKVFVSPFPRKEGRERLILVVVTSPDTATVRHDVGVLMNRIMVGNYW